MLASFEGLLASRIGASDRHPECILERRSFDPLKVYATRAGPLGYRTLDRPQAAQVSASERCVERAW